MNKDVFKWLIQLAQHCKLILIYYIVLNVSQYVWIDWYTCICLITFGSTM